MSAHEATSRSYYAGKLESLRDLFGERDVAVEGGTLRVGAKRFPIVDDVIVLLPPELQPPALRARLSGDGAGSREELATFSRDVQASFGEEWQLFDRVLPEHEAGTRLAHALVDPPHDQIDLPHGTTIRAMRCPGPLAGHTLSELELLQRFGVTVLLVQSDTLVANPEPNVRINTDDVLLVYGPERGIRALAEWRP